MTKQFLCPNKNCGMWYEATWEQSPVAVSGSFKCTDCKTEVHKWSGIDCYVGWRQITMKSPRPMGDTI